MCTFDTRFYLTDLGICSFGFGGTNAHVILESWEDNLNTGQQLHGSAQSDSLWGPIVLSAHSGPALTQSAFALCQTLKTAGSTINLADLCWTLQSRRTEFQYKMAFSAESLGQLIEELECVGKKATKDRLQPISAKTAKVSTPFCILGVFTGQGAQWPLSK